MKGKVFLLSVLLLIVAQCNNIILVSADNDANSGGDAGDDYSSALLITKGSHTGTLTGSDSSDRFDYYKIYLYTGDVINVTMTPHDSEDDFTLNLNDPSEVSTGQWTHEGPGEAENIEYAADSIGGWYIIVNLPSLTAYDGDYTLEITVTPQNDGNTGGDAGNDFSTASTITFGSFTGILTGFSDDYDYYQIDLIDSDTITVTMTPDESKDFNLALYDPFYSNVAYSAIGGEGESETFTYQVDSTGHWYIVVQIPAFEYYKGNYTLSIQSGDSITTTSKSSTTTSSNVSTTEETTNGWHLLILVPTIVVFVVKRKIKRK